MTICHTWPFIFPKKRFENKLFILINIEEKTKTNKQVELIRK